MRRTGIGMVAAVSVLALTGCNSGHDVKSRSKQANEPVVYATALTSPDGKRIAVVTHNRSAIEVGPASGGHRRTIYRSAPLGITADFYWASPYLIVFDTDLSVSTIDVRTRHVRQIASGAYGFGMSPDGRWVAWQSGGFDGPSTVGIVSVNGDKNCRFVPRPPNWQDAFPFFKRGVNRLFFTREPYSSATDEPKGPSRVMSVPISSLCH